MGKLGRTLVLALRGTAAVGLLRAYRCRSGSTNEVSRKRTNTSKGSSAHPLIHEVDTTDGSKRPAVAYFTVNCATLPLTMIPDAGPSGVETLKRVLPRAVEWPGGRGMGFGASGLATAMASKTARRITMLIDELFQWGKRDF